MLITATKIEQNSLKESSDYVTDSFPFRTGCSDILEYPCHSFPWHWHEDIEILYVTNGKLIVKTPGNQVILSEGDIIFIPSNVLHSTAALDNHPGVHKEYIFSPLFLSGSWNSIIMQKYILPLINGISEYMIIRDNDINSKEMQVLLSDIQNLAEKEPAYYEFNIRHLLENVWLLLLETAKDYNHLSPRHTNQDRLYKMLEFIQNHFSEEITLNDIANSAGASTRECNRCFRNSLHITTMDYLLEYRINQACTMLVTSDYSITEVGYNCGFTSASYFTKRFREKLSMTPKEYRNKSRNTNNQ